MILGLDINCSAAKVGLQSGYGIAALTLGCLIWSIVPRLPARRRGRQAIPAPAWIPLTHVRLTSI